MEVKGRWKGKRMKWKKRRVKRYEQRKGHEGGRLLKKVARIRIPLDELKYKENFVIFQLIKYQLVKA